MPRRQTHQGLKFPTENILTHTLFRVDKLLFFGYLIVKEAVRLLFHEELDSGGCEKQSSFFFMPSPLTFPINFAIIAL